MNETIFSSITPHFPFFFAIVIIAVIIGLAIGTIKEILISFVSTRIGAAIALLVIAGVVIKQGFL